ncbi:MAG: bifunctional oligoribonuclease/PAP phosphatase NrnA [Bacillaceae bacterium]|nr:bifunctional oligoribonuclease/PAP phosphatase NrnA [Bacillaceae bacterium]
MIEQIIKYVEENETIIIHRHERPDPDALGSQAGLAELLSTHYPKKNIYTVGEEEESLTFIRKMDEIKDEKFEKALIIVCDTANTERISDNRYEKGNTIIKIDHHPNEDPYGDVNWVDTSASSTCEMIYDLYKVFHKNVGMKMTDFAARCLFTGIVGDTGRFRYPNTTTKTFQIVSELVGYQFSPVEIYERMEQKSLQDARLEGYILANFELMESGAGFMNLPTTLLQQYNVTTSEASKLVNTFANVNGMKAWVFFVEEPDGLIRVRLRSKGPIINKLAQKYNGGGHPLASGASAKSWEETKNILVELEELCKQFK